MSQQAVDVLVTVLVVGGIWCGLAVVACAVWSWLFAPKRRARKNR